MLEEIGSLVVVLRLWRVFKVRPHGLDTPLLQQGDYSSLANNHQIIEELSAGADEQMEPLREKIEDLELANTRLKKDIAELKAKRSISNNEL